MPTQTFEQPLTRAAMVRMMDRIMTGQCPEDEVSAFLRTLARRGETAEEIAAAVESLRKHALALPVSSSLKLCDTCGTGGDGHGTINVSTLTALVVAAAGVRVAKHGNRAASSRCGSADLLEALGVNLEASPRQVARSIEELGFGFVFARTFHPAMKAVAPIRKALGIRTLFNLVGPLANPAPLAYQLVGVSESGLMRPMAEALQRLGIRHGMVVHGTDGLDEVSTTAKTEVLEVLPEGIAAMSFEPEALGLQRATLEDLKGGDTAHNARRARDILGGEPGAQRDLIVANAACVLYVTHQARTVEEGATKAAEVLASGQSLRLLERVKDVSRHDA